MTRIIFLLISLSTIALSTAAHADESTPSQRAAYETAAQAYSLGKYDRTLELIAPLVLRGMPEAQNLLGDMYRLGKGVAKDPEEAEHWYGKAADQGYAVSQSKVSGSTTGVPMAQPAAFSYCYYLQRSWIGRCAKSRRTKGSLGVPADSISVADTAPAKTPRPLISRGFDQTH